MTKTEAPERDPNAVTPEEEAAAQALSKMPREERRLRAEKLAIYLRDQDEADGAVLLVALLHDYDALLADRDRLAAQGGGWRDVEKNPPPKDGTRVLAWFGETVGVQAVTWEEPANSDHEIWCVDDGKHGPFALRGYNDPFPTRWQPLPDAPDAAAIEPAPLGTLTGRGAVDVLVAINEAAESAALAIKIAAADAIRAAIEPAPSAPAQSGDDLLLAEQFESLMAQDPRGAAALVGRLAGLLVGVDVPAAPAPAPAPAGDVREAARVLADACPKDDPPIDNANPWSRAASIAAYHLFYAIQRERIHQGMPMEAVRDILAALLPTPQPEEGGAP